MRNEENEKLRRYRYIKYIDIDIEKKSKNPVFARVYFFKR